MSSRRFIWSVRRAAEGRYRRRLVRRVAEELAHLQRHPAAWAAYVAEAEATMVADGLC